MKNEIIDFNNSSFNKPLALSVIEKVNPIAQISQVIIEVMDYKYKIKSLEIEKEKIYQEAQLRHHHIDAALKVALEKIEERRIIMDNNFKAAMTELNANRLERNNFCNTVNNLTNGLLSKELPLEEKELIMATIPVVNEMIKNCGNNSQLILNKLIASNDRALEMSGVDIKSITYGG